MRAFLFSALLLSLPAAAHGQGFVPDRLGFTYATGLVSKGRVQVEMGLPDALWTAETVAGQRVEVLLAAVNVLVRYGAGTRWEVQVGTAPITFSRVNGESSETTASSLYLSGKALLHDGDVAVSVQPEAEVPFDDEDVYVGAVLAAETEFESGLQAGASAGAGVQGGEVSVPLAMYVGADVRPGLNVFGELAGFAGDGGFDGPWVGVGGTLLAAPRAVLDASVQHRVGEARWGFGVGLSLLF